MQGNPAVHRLVAPVANRFFGKADREDSGVVSTAQRHTYSLDSPRIADCVAMSDFRFADLREGAVTIFLCLSSDRIDTYSRWLRLIVVEALTAPTRSRATPPCLTASLCCSCLMSSQRLAGWSLSPRGMGLMAGYGVYALRQFFEQAGSETLPVALIIRSRRPVKRYCYYFS